MTRFLFSITRLYGGEISCSSKSNNIHCHHPELLLSVHWSPDPSSIYIICVFGKIFSNSPIFQLHSLIYSGSWEWIVVNHVDIRYQDHQSSYHFSSVDRNLSLNKVLIFVVLSHLNSNFTPFSSQLKCLHNFFEIFDDSKKFRFLIKLFPIYLVHRIVRSFLLKL